jgi:hypothetical protein
MVLHRALGQEQARRDLAVRRATRNQAQDVGLPGGQLAWLPLLDGDCPVGRAGYRLGQDWLRWNCLGRGWLALTGDCRRQPADSLRAELGNAGRLTATGWSPRSAGRPAAARQAAARRALLGTMRVVRPNRPDDRRRRAGA